MNSSYSPPSKSRFTPGANSGSSIVITRSTVFQLPREPCTASASSAVDEEEARARVIEDVAHFVAVEARVDRDEHAARERDAEAGIEHRGNIVREERDAVAAPDAVGAERGREPPDALTEFRVRVLALAVDDADPRRVDALGALEEEERRELRTIDLSHACGLGSSSIFAASTKSLTVRPLILCVQIVTSTLPQARRMSG